MATIESVGHRGILDSPVAFTTEYVVRMDDGTTGIGASSEGETASIYEDKRATDAVTVIGRLRSDRLMGRLLAQEGCWDDHLSWMTTTFGRNTCFALSRAFYDAEQDAGWRSGPEGVEVALPCPQDLLQCA